VQNFNFIRNFTPKPLGELQAVMCSAVKLSLDIDAGLIIVLSRNGVIARMVAKYRPRVATLLVTDSEEVPAFLPFSSWCSQKP
jgi:pyruvate kinase